MDLGLGLELEVELTAVRNRMTAAVVVLWTLTLGMEVLVQGRKRDWW